MPDNVWVIRYCSANTYNKESGILLYDSFELREGEESISLSSLTFSTKNKRSIEWLVRRIIQIQSLKYKDKDFFIVMQAKELRKEIGSLVIEYDPQKEVFNHLLIYPLKPTRAKSKILSRKIVNLANKNLKKRMYRFGDFKCTHNEFCLYSAKKPKLDKGET